MTQPANIIKEVKKPAPLNEAGVQRQHIRIRLPANVKMGKSTYKIENLSAGGFSIHTGRNFINFQTAEEIHINVPFESFAFHIKATVMPVYHNEKKEIAGFRFKETDQRHASQINHIIKSYQSGQLTAKDDLIAVIARNDNVFSPSHENSANNDSHARGRLGRIGPVIAVAVVCTFGLVMLLGNVYGKSGFVKNPVNNTEDIGSSGKIFRN